VSLMTEHAVNSRDGERRVALEKRRRVAEMSPEEMRRELLTSEVTGLPNRRAFDEAGATPAVAMCDVDGLKALNKYGYEAGNVVLKAKADALREAGLEAYHDKGDEFLCRGTQIMALVARLERARATLRHRTIVVEGADGSTLSFTGADFSYGVGKDIDEAEFHLKRHKAEREGSGEIARGELRGITIKVEKPEPSPPESSHSPAIGLAACRETPLATN
jgi:GGDEF domain-containing protein